MWQDLTTSKLFFKKNISLISKLSPSVATYFFSFFCFVFRQIFTCAPGQSPIMSCRPFHILCTAHLVSKWKTHKFWRKWQLGQVFARVRIIFVLHTYTHSFSLLLMLSQWAQVHRLTNAENLLVTPRRILHCSMAYLLCAFSFECVIIILGWLPFNSPIVRPRVGCRWEIVAHTKRCSQIIFFCFCFFFPLKNKNSHQFGLDHAENVIDQILNCSD